jgi:hypothetical protein
MATTTAKAGDSARDHAMDSGARGQSGQSKVVILILLFLGWCLGNMDRLAMSYGVVPIGKEFNLSSSLVGLVLG